MSTTKVFVIFGVIVFALACLLWVLEISFPSMLGRYIGLVENFVVTMVGAYVVAIVLDFTLQRSQEKAREKVAKVGISEASQVINRMMSLFTMMVKASSNGFIPSTIKELFGIEAAGLISLHLNLDKPAPVTSSIPWRNYITMEARYVLDRLSFVHTHYLAFLHEDALVALAQLRNNPLLQVLSEALHTTAVGQDISHPVLNIPLESLTPLMSEMLVSVEKIQQEAERLNTAIVPNLSRFALRDNVKPKIGDSRFEGQPGPRIFIGKEPPA